MKPDPIAFAPPPWQLPHLLAIKPGERGLVAAPLTDLPPWEIDESHPPARLGEIFLLYSKQLPSGIKEHWDIECPLGPVGGVIACKEPLSWNPRIANLRYEDGSYIRNDRFRSMKKRFAASLPRTVDKTISAKKMPIEFCRLFLRVVSIDLRRTDTMTNDEFIAWGAGIIETLPNGAHGVQSAEDRWNQDHPAQPWGAWAWFVEIERSECGWAAESFEGITRRDGR